MQPNLTARTCVLRQKYIGKRAYIQLRRLSGARYALMIDQNMAPRTCRFLVQGSRSATCAVQTLLFSETAGLYREYERCENRRAYIPIHRYAIKAGCDYKVIIAPSSIIVPIDRRRTKDEKPKSLLVISEFLETHNMQALRTRF